jgi:hypothetical protein
MAPEHGLECPHKKEDSLKTNGINGMSMLVGMSNVPKS